MALSRAVLKRCNDGTSDKWTRLRQGRASAKGHHQQSHEVHDQGCRLRHRGARRSSGRTRAAAGRLVEVGTPDIVVAGIDLVIAVAVGRQAETPGAFVHEIGGIETHVHMAVSIRPTLLISEFIGQLKGGSSHDVNQAIGRNQKVIEWQAGYGVVSFGTRDMPWVVEYIRNQREHHARGTVHERLERITQEEPAMVVAQAATARRPVNGPG